MISAAQRVSASEVSYPVGVPWTDAVKAAIELILYGLIGSGSGTPKKAPTVSSTG